MLIGSVFLVFAFITLFVSVNEYRSWNRFKNDAVPVTAYISEIETYTDSDNEKQHNVYIEYEYEGVSYSDKLNYYISGMKKGDSVQIYVDLYSPSINKSYSSVYNTVAILFALLFGGIGGGLVGHEVKRAIFVNRLISEDKYVFAVYSHEEKSNYSVNDVVYDRSVFVYDDGSGGELTFNSEPYPPDSHPYSDGSTVRVYVDIEADPKKYYVSREK